MEELADCLDANKWQKLDVSQKKDFKEFQVMRQHKQVNPNCFRYLIQTYADEDPKGVTVEFTNKGKDPLKDIGTAELLLKENKVVGIDLDGDCFVMK